LGRAWQDGAGNFMGSTVVHLGAQDPAPQTLAFVTGLAVHDSLHVLAPQLVCQLKWPNDILLEAAKLAGCLIERAGHAVIVGVGVNIAMAPQVEGRSTTSLKAEGFDIDRNVFAETLAQRFADRLVEWRSGGWPDAQIADWIAAAHPRGTLLTLTEGAQAGLTAAFDGLERDGSLRLRLGDGAVQTVHAGEVQLIAHTAQQGNRTDAARN
jgi:BirA family transcriptional regulator, biotin operon repressor / biotin---[acetyl-CoA-carboxylase] ligase